MLARKNMTFKFIIRFLLLPIYQALEITLET